MNWQYIPKYSDANNECYEDIHLVSFDGTNEYHAYVIFDKEKRQTYFNGRYQNIRTGEVGVCNVNLSIKQLDWILKTARELFQTM